MKIHYKQYFLFLTTVFLVSKFFRFLPFTASPSNTLFQNITEEFADVTTSSTTTSINVEAEMFRRAAHIRSMCSAMTDSSRKLKKADLWIENPDGSKHLAYGNEVWYSNTDKSYNQFLLLSSFLVFPKLKLSYCWLHKGGV